MNHRLSLWIFSTIVFLLALAGCGPVTAVAQATPTPKTALSPAPAPAIQVKKDQVGPSLVGQTPAGGQRLELSPSLQFVFDRAMDQAKTAHAFTFLDPDHNSVPGKSTWLNSKTFTFTPDAKLTPSSVYRAVFSTAAVGLDGKPLQDEIWVEFTTNDTLVVGQVFPID